MSNNRIAICPINVTLYDKNGNPINAKCGLTHTPSIDYERGKVTYITDDEEDDDQYEIVCIGEVVEEPIGESRNH